MQSSFGRAYKHGEFVFQRGDAADAVYVITKGEGEVITQGVHGDKTVLALAPGDVFGETALLEGREKRAASVRASSDLEVLVISADVFHQLAKPEGGKGSELASKMREQHSMKLEHINHYLDLEDLCGETPEWTPAAAAPAAAPPVVVGVEVAGAEGDNAGKVNGVYDAVEEPGERDDAAGAFADHILDGHPTTSPITNQGTVSP